VGNIGGATGVGVADGGGLQAVNVIAVTVVSITKMRRWREKFMPGIAPTNLMDISI
jgi:hypothetical protein